MQPSFSEWINSVRSYRGVPAEQQYEERIASLSAQHEQQIALLDAQHEQQLHAFQCPPALM